MRIAVALLALGTATGALADQRPDPTALEWRLQAPRTGTQVVASTAKVFWTASSSGAVAGTSVPGVLPRLRDPSRSRVRVLAVHDTADPAVYIDIADLETVIRQRAIVTPSRSAASAAFEAKTPGIHLEPGSLARLERRGAAVSRISVRDEQIRGRGFVRADAVGFDYTPAPARRWKGDSVGIKPGTAFRQRPGGAVVARLARKLEGPVATAVVLERRGRHVLVACGDSGVTAVGWVSNDRISEEAWGLGMVGTGIGGGGHGGRTVKLPAGTILRESKAGEVVGMMSRTARVFVVASEGEWTRVKVPTALGKLPLWASSVRAALGGD